MQQASRIYQRIGRIVRFQWSSQDRDEWGRILDSVKAIPGRRFVSESKFWEAPWDQHACQVIQAAGFVPGEIVVTVKRNLEAEAKALADVRREKEEKRKSAIRALLEAPWTPPWEEILVDEEKLPGRRHYQIDSMRFLTYRNGRGLIGDDMGTGKSCQALSWLELHPEHRPAIIVSTTSTKYQWLQQQRLWMSKDASPIEILSGQRPHKWQPLSPNRIYVVNWEILAYWADWLDKLDPKIIVGDEIQAIGNMTSQRTKAFRKLAAPLHRHVLPMSGTPITSKPLQFFPVLNLLDPVEFKDFRKFQYRYCNLHKTAFGMDNSGSSHMEELHLKIRNLMIRRTKADVMKELPEKVRTPVLLPITKDSEYEALEEKVLGLQGAPIKEIKERLNELSRSAFGVKRKAILDWVEEFLAATDEKLLIFGWHQAVIEALTMHFGKQCITINGGVDPRDRPALVKRFQEDPKCRICVANILAGGTGIDGLQDVCSNVAFVELSTVPAYVMQAEDRLHRMGQRSSTGVWYLLASGTVDEDMLAVVEERRAMLGTILDGKIADGTDDAFLVLERMKQRKGRG